MDILIIAAARKNIRLKNYRIDFIAGAHAGCLECKAKVDCTKQVFQSCDAGRGHRRRVTGLKHSLPIIRRGAYCAESKFATIAKKEIHGDSEPA